MTSALKCYSTLLSFGLNILIDRYNYFEKQCVLGFVSLTDEDFDSMDFAADFDNASNHIDIFLQKECGNVEKNTFSITDEALNPYNGRNVMLRKLMDI